MDIILFKGNSVDVNEAVVFDFNGVTSHADYSLYNGVTLPRNVKDNNVTTLDFGNLVEDEGVPLFYCFHHVAIAVRHVLSAVQGGEHTVTAHRDCGDDVSLQKQCGCKGKQNNHHHRNNRGDDFFPTSIGSFKNFKFFVHCLDYACFSAQYT